MRKCCPPSDHDHEHKGHDHDHDHAPDRAPQAILGAIVITALFMLIEFVGGWLANSLALLSDAAHMLTDLAALLLSLFAVWVARRPSSPTMSFGYYRAEILGALVNGLAIWLIAGVLVFEAFLRLKSPPEVQGKMVFIIATIGLAANLAAMRFLHGSRKDSMNVRAAYLHLLSDTLGSVAAIIAGAVLWWTGWRPIDPIVTIFFAILMLASSWHLIKEAIEVLMESTPSRINPREVKKDLAALAGVEEVHDLHIWTVSTGRLSLAVHLIVKGAFQSSAILTAANELLTRKYGIVHTTIQIEDPAHFRLDACYDCHNGE